jgi:diadenosine tetraphosphate (Ap4A) HIT family hydrolase
MRRNYPIFVMAGLDPASHVLLFQLRTKKRGYPDHLGAKTRFCPGMTGSCLRGYSLQGCSKIEKPLMPSDASAWSLHSQLKKDTIDIGDLPLCKVLVIKDAHYPWLLLVPRREGAVEIIDLDEVAQAQLMTEISRVSRALKEITQCDKLNVAALGNLVPQLHVHVIARRTSDVAWPRPVWGVMPPLAHDAEEVQNFINALRRKIWLG